MLFHCRVFQILQDLLRDPFPSGQIHDLHRKIIICICKQQDFKIRRLHVFVQS